MKTGKLDMVVFYPGRADLLQAVIGEGHHSFSISPGDGIVTCNGELVALGSLFEWLSSQTAVMVTLHPEASRYQVSLHTDFRSV